MVPIRQILVDFFPHVYGPSHTRKRKKDRNQYSPKRTILISSFYHDIFSVSGHVKGKHLLSFLCRFCELLTKIVLQNMKVKRFLLDKNG